MLCTSEPPDPRGAVPPLVEAKSRLAPRPPTDIKVMPLKEWAEWQPDHGQEVTNVCDQVPGFRYVDLFAGVGCASLALEPLRCKCVLACEWDKVAQGVLQSHYKGPLVNRFEDMRASHFRGAEVAFVSCPCQPFSLGGNRRGVMDVRGTYMFRSADLLVQAQVPVLVFEMVPNFLKVDAGAVAAAFVDRLERGSYKVYSQVLNGVNFDAPQWRERVFFVAVNTSVVKRCGEWTFPLPNSYERPVSSVLDNEFKSMTTVCTVRSVEWHASIEQVPGAKGTPVRVGRSGVGKRTGNYVHSVDHPICTQKSSPFCQGPGATTGLIARQTRYGTRVTKLSVRESGRCMQLPDWLVLPEGEAGYKVVGNGVCVEVLRAVGRKLKQYLSCTSGPLAVVDGGSGNNETVVVSAGLREPGIARSAADEHGHTVCPHQFLREVRLAALARVVKPWAARLRWRKCRLRSLVRAVNSMRVPSSLESALIADGRKRVNAWLHNGMCELLWWDCELWADLREGGQCPLVSEVPAFAGKNYPTANHPKVSPEFDRMVAINAFEYVTCRDVKVVTPIAVVPKADSDKIRIIVDFSKSGFNDNIRRMPFVLPSFDDFLGEVSRGDFVGVIDFSDQFPVHKSCRPLLGVRLPDGRIGRFKSWPFGTRCSPYVFCRFVSFFRRQVEREYGEGRVVHVVNDPSSQQYDATLPVVFRVWGCDAADGCGTGGCVGGVGAGATDSGAAGGAVKLASFTVFVDDCAVCASSRGECKRAMSVYLRVAARYGLRVNHSKTIHPTQRGAKFQGFLVDTVSDPRGVVVSIPESKVAEVSSLVSGICEMPAGTEVSRRDVASLIGKLSHLTTIVKLGRAFLRRMYDCLHGIGDEALVLLDYDQVVPLTEEAKVDLAWWQDLLSLVKSSVLWQSRVVTLKRHQWTDASGAGFGWSKVEGNHVRFRHGLWPSECSSFSSNGRELKTILLAVSANPESLSGCEVHTYTDNAVSESCVNHSTSTSESLMVLVRELVRLQMKHDFRLVAHWVPGSRGPRAMTKQGTDGLSRGSNSEGAMSGAVAPLHFLPPSPTSSVPLDLVAHLCGEGDVIVHPSQWYGEQVHSVWSPPPSLVRRAMSAYLDQKLRMPDLTSAHFVVFDYDTDPWWRWTRSGRHFKVVRRVEYTSELGQAHSLPHDVLVLESPLGFLSDV